MSCQYTWQCDRIPDIALPSVLHQICSTTDPFDLRYESVTYIAVDNAGMFEDTIANLK